MIGFREIGERTCLGGVFMGLEMDVTTAPDVEGLNFKGDTGLGVVAALVAESRGFALGME